MLGAEQVQHVVHQDSRYRYYMVHWLAADLVFAFDYYAPGYSTDSVRIDLDVYEQVDFSHMPAGFYLDGRYNSVVSWPVPILGSGDVDAVDAVVLRAVEEYLGYLDAGTLDMLVVLKQAVHDLYEGF